MTPHFKPGEIAIIRHDAVDCTPEYWGMEVEIISGPELMSFWRDKNINRPPDIHAEPAYYTRCQNGREGYVFAISLKKRPPPREPTVSWDDVPYWNPTKQLIDLEQ